MTIYRGFSTFNRLKKYKLTDYELAKQDLFNHFQIRKGEKLMNPNFGSIIWNLLYEPLTEEIKQRMVSDINNIVAYDPRMSVESMTITEFGYGIQIELLLQYIPTNQTEAILLKFEKNSMT